MNEKERFADARKHARLGTGKYGYGGEPVPVARDLATIAREISADWRKPYFGAVPYLQAMATLRGVDATNVHAAKYGLDSADSIVRYFLGNANAWRGETARRVKAELRRLVR